MIIKKKNITLEQWFLALKKLHGRDIREEGGRISKRFPREFSEWEKLAKSRDFEALPVEKTHNGFFGKPEIYYVRDYFICLYGK